MMKQSKRNFNLIFLLLLIIVAVPLFYTKFEQPLKIHLLDVGEGDSILIQTPKHKTILIDAGNPVTGQKVIQYLKKHHIKKIDHLIFTHPDQDHIGGIFYLLQRLKIKNIYDNGENLTSYFKASDFYYWYDQLVRKDENYQRLEAGESIQVGKVMLNVLWPPTPLPFNWFNPNSVVLMLKYGDFKALLTGDLVEMAEKKLLQKEVSLDADLLKSGHHGSDDATTDPFLDAVSPKMVLISANHKDRRPYPGNLALERLQKREIPYFRTDFNGDILLTIKSNGEIKVKTEKK